MRVKREQILVRAMEEAGGPAEIARFISKHYGPITTQAVSLWRKCPAKRAFQVEAAIKARQKKLRGSLADPITARDLLPPWFREAMKV